MATESRIHIYKSIYTNDNNPPPHQIHHSKSVHSYAPLKGERIGGAQNKVVVDYSNRRGVDSNSNTDPRTRYMSLS